MKTMTVGEFKAHFAEVLEQVKSGIGIAVTYGRRKEIVGYFLPKSKKSKNKRKLGLMQGKASATFKPDYKMTEEEFLG
jgi:antitoxin (DNA-binding transcriptional repressor) of toxin-antitoxin stability system